MSLLLLVQALARAGSSDPFVEFDTLSATYGLSVGDVDGDGKSEIVLAYEAVDQSGRTVFDVVGWN